MPLDERIFQDQGFEFAGGNNHLKVGHFFNHGRDLREVLAVEITAHAVFELLGLADVDHLAVLVEHDIHARQQRQTRGLLAQCFAQTRRLPS